MEEAILETGIPFIDIVDWCIARHDSVVEKDGIREDGVSVEDNREA